jgi:steroid delta-isomerase
MEGTPALAASQASWRCVQAGDKEGWLGLMTDDVLIEDPIGPSVTNPEGKGARGKEAVAAFFDRNIAGNRLTVTCEETFPSSSPLEVAHILVLRAEFPAGGASTVRGVFTYRVDEAGKLAAMRGYWRVEDMTFEE